MSLLKKQHRKFSHLILTTMLCWFFSPNINAVNTVEPQLIWLKPLESDQLMQGYTIIKGDALNLMVFVANQISDVEHKFEAYPIRRSWRLVQNTKQEQLAYCFWGADYKKERDDWGYFTQPNSVELPYLVAAKKGKLDAFAQDGAISVQQLLKNGYSTVIFEEVSNPLTDVIKQVGYTDTVKVSGLDKDLSDHTLLMIEKGRIDFGYVSFRALANLNVYNNPHITLYEVRELTLETLKDGRILCSKSPFGKKMAMSIDRVFQTIKNDAKLRGIFKDLIFKAEGYPSHFKQTFEKQWDRAYINQTLTDK